MTAEAAVVLPALVAVTLLLAGVIGAATSRVRCIDAAHEAARQAARQATYAEVVAAGRRAAGTQAADIDVATQGGRVRVRVRMPVRGLPARLGHWQVTAVAEARLEPEVGPP